MQPTLQLVVCHPPTQINLQIEHVMITAGTKMAMHHSCNRICQCKLRSIKPHFSMEREREILCMLGSTEELMTEIRVIRNSALTHSTPNRCSTLSCYIKTPISLTLQLSLILHKINISKGTMSCRITAYRYTFSSC